MKYGKVVEVGKTISFMCPRCPTSASNPDTERAQGVQLRVQLRVQLEAEVSNLPVSAALKEDRLPNVQESNLDTKLDIETEVGHGVGNAKPLSDKDFGSKLSTLSTLSTALNEELAELANFVRVVLAENDWELAQNIQSILKDVCGVGAVDRKQVWNALTPEEKTALTALLKPYTETEEIVITSWLALMEATLRLTIVSGKPMYNQNRFPSHDHANRSPSLKFSTFTEPLGISQIYRIECLGLSLLVTPFY